MFRQSEGCQNLNGPENLTHITTGWWFGTWILWLSTYWEFHDRNWRTHILQRGRAQPPTSWLFFACCAMSFLFQIWIFLDAWYQSGFAQWTLWRFVSSRVLQSWGPPKLGTSELWRRSPSAKESSDCSLMAVSSLMRSHCQQPMSWQRLR